MARSVRESIVLGAPPERVWDAVMDPSLLERWVTTHDSYEGAAPGTLEDGDEFTQQLRLAGKGFNVRWRVVEADAPRLARWEGDGPAGSTANVVYRLARRGRRDPVRVRERVRASGRRARQGRRRPALGGARRSRGAALARAPGRPARGSLESPRRVQGTETEV